MAIQSLNPNPTLTPRTTYTGVPTSPTPEQIQARTEATTGAPQGETLAQMQERVRRQGMQGYDVFGNPVQKPAISEPQVSTTVASSVAGGQIANWNTKRLEAQKAGKGTYVGGDGFVHYVDDDSLVPAPLGAMQGEAGNWTYNGFNYGEMDLGTQQEWQLKNETDAITRRYIEGIQKKYDLLTQQQEQVNKSMEAGRMKSLLMSGTARYSPTMAEGIMGIQKSYGIQQIAQLEAEEASLINQAEQAHAQNDQVLLEKSIARAEVVRKEKQETAKKLAETLQTELKKQNEIKTQIDKENFIAGLVDENPNITQSQILAEAQKAGINATIKDINETMAGINPDAKLIQTLVTKLTEYGVDSEIVGKVLKSRSYNEALSYASPYMQDPKIKLDIQTSILDQKLKQVQIAKIQKETQLLGEPTPNEKKKENDALKSKEGTNLILQDKIDLIDGLLKSPGISARVGTSVLTRTPTGGWFGKTIGTIAKGVSTLGIGTILDAKAGITGQGQQFSGGVHKLASKEFLDALISAKQQGATFGALTDREGDALRASATQLNDWEIKDEKGLGTGVWNIDEASFIKELKNIQDLAKRSISRSGVVTPDEQSILDSAFGAENETETSDPSLYY